LFREGVAPTVVASGRRLRPNAGISELMEHDLVERGVPREKIVRLSHDADSTKEEAVSVAKLAQEMHWKRIVVVTSNYHTRRARYIFSRVFPTAITVKVASARDGSFDPERWWEKRESIKLFAHEVAGMVVAVWELRRPEKQAARAALAKPERSWKSGLWMLKTQNAGKSLLALYKS
jgi:vancomycin permeability regulator SanA